MRSTQDLEVVGFSWDPDSDQPCLPDSPCATVLEDDEAQQRAFVEEMYRDLGVGD